MTSLRTSRLHRRIAGGLLLTVSGLALALPAHAKNAIYTTDRAVAAAAEKGERVTQQGGLTQIRLDNGGTASFVDGASFQIRADGSIDLFAGSVTVAGGEGGPVVVHLADKGEGRVAGSQSAASFTVQTESDGRTEARGHVLNGAALIAVGGGAPRRFEAGQMWHSNGGRPSLTVSVGEAPVPEGGDGNPQVADMNENGPLAAAENGVPVVLGDALAAAGASGDIVAAARRVQAAAAAPALETFPSGDLAQLVAYAGRLEGAYGGVPFNGAAADIIRTYLQYLAGGGSGAQFLTVYAGLMGQYLDLMRSSALPSSFAGASQAQINAFIAYRGRTSGFGALSSANRTLVEAYLAFIQQGGAADQFVPRYTSLTDAYFAFLRGGGDPVAFQGASQQTINAYLVFLRDSGLLVRLSAQNQALLNAYLASQAGGGSGFAFAEQYRTALAGYYAYLQQGRLPSSYSAADIAALRSYLETLQATGLFDRVLGEQAQFYAGYLAWLQGGGSVDGYAQLPANVFTGYAAALATYYDYLKQGGVPSAYSGLTQAQIRAYLAALDGAGATGRYLGDLGEFWGLYFTYLAGGGNPDTYVRLPVPPDYPAFASALNAYAAYLAGGGLPSGYSALTLEQLQVYIQAIIAAGRTGELLGANATLLSGYFAYLSGGGTADRWSGLPVYANYASALQAYYAFLAGGGLPASYSALSLAQIQAYLQALINAGVYGTLVTGDAAAVLSAYYLHVSGGGSAGTFTGLPVYANYVSALQAYYAYLIGGGLPSNYTAVSLAQLQAYLQALIDAGVFNSLVSGDARTFLASYYTYVSGGGTPNNYSALPGNSGSGSVGGGATGTLTTYSGGFTATSGLNLYAASNDVSGWFGSTEATVAADGSFSSSTGRIRPGTAAFTDVAGDARGVIGRMTSGTVLIDGNSYSYTANSGLAYALMAPIVGVMPSSGTVSYSLLSATRPVYGDGRTAPGTFAADLTVGFGSSLRYAMNGTITMPDATYTFSTPGGATGALQAAQAGTNPAFFIIRPALSATGPACTSGTGCFVNFYGGFGGSNPQERLGFGYVTVGTGGTANRINGAALFGSTGAGGSGIAANFAGANMWLFNNGGGRVAASPTTVVASDGQINSVMNGDSVSFAFGSPSVVREKGRVGDTVAWSRWDGSATASRPNPNDHVLVGAPAVSLPASGKVDYVLIGGTAPTNYYGADGSSGTFTGALSVQYGSAARVGFNFDVAVGTRSWRVSTSGGAANPATGLAVSSAMRFESTSVATTGLTSGSCAAFCNTGVFGGLFGTGGSHAGLAYLIQDESGGFPGAYVNGTAVFASSGTSIGTLGAAP